MLVFYVGDLIITHAVFTHIQEKVGICVCNIKDTGIGISKCSIDNDQKKNGLKCVHQTSGHIPDIAVSFDVFVI